MSQKLLSIESLSIYFGEKKSRNKVVDQLSFDIYQSQCLALVGESGSGKTISSLALMQLLPTTAIVSKQSHVYSHLDEKMDWLDYSENQMQAIRGQRIAMIFQDALTALDPVYTIGQQMHDALKAHCRLNKIQRTEKIQALLHEVALDDSKRIMNAYPHQLSGGQRQRAMIAMSLLCDPDILIADEPCTALDVNVQNQVIDLLLSLKKKRKLAIIFISHDLGIVKALADHIIVMQKGQVIEKNSADAFFKQPKASYSQMLLNSILPKQAALQSDQNKEDILCVSHLKKYFTRHKNTIKAVDDVSLVCKQGETLALVGESGSGKSTTAKTIIGLLKKNSGQIKLHADLDNIQYIFQDPYSALNPRMMVIDIILEGYLLKHKLNKAQKIQKAKNLLSAVSIEPSAIYRYPHQFSGGQRQRIAIARAIAMEPQMLILDEPTSALDVSVQQSILDLLASLQHTLGLSYLLITHDMGVVAKMAHHVAVMKNGHIVECGTTASVFAKPQHDYTKLLLSSIG